MQIYAKGRPKKITEPISFIFNEENYDNLRFEG